MTKITYSPLISSISGKMGNNIFSSWKGQPYVKELVTPANPQSVAQQANRQYYSNSSFLWRKIYNRIRKHWNDAAAADGISGFNKWVRDNRQPPANYFLTYSTPYHPDIPKPENFDIASGPSSGDAVLAWTGGPWGSGHPIYVFTHTTTISSFTFLSFDTFEADLLTCTLVVPYAPGTVEFFISVNNPALETASGSARKRRFIV